MKRLFSPEEPKMGIPETFLPYVGTYTIPMSQADFSVLVIDDRLALQTPDGEIIELAETDMEGHWIFVEDEKNSVSFVLNRNGEISAMSLHSIFTLPKKNERPDSHSSWMENVNGCADST